MELKSGSCSLIVYIYIYGNFLCLSCNSKQSYKYLGQPTFDIKETNKINYNMDFGEAICLQTNKSLTDDIG